MSTYELSPAALARTREKLIHFIKTHGERRITSRAIRWLQTLSDEALEQEGTLLLVYTQNKKLLGLLAVSEYGIHESFIIVHRKVRRHGIGKTLTEEVVQRLGKLYVRVAADNMASLKTCFSTGMVAFACMKGVTGKPTLWLAAGEWNKKDVRIL
jgi:GNAT superfamily N-acetyltransferase